MALMFAYISSSPFIFQEHYKLRPLTYSILFGFNALALTLGALLASFFINQVRSVHIGAFGLFLLSIVTVFILFSDAAYIYFEISIFIMFIFNGLIYASSTTLALVSNQQNAGTASALLGTIAFLFGGIISPLSGLGDILHATSIAIISCSSIVFFLVLQHIYSTHCKFVLLAYLRVTNKLD